MPPNIQTIGNGFPEFNGSKSPQEQIRQMYNYLFQLREGLDYSLRNLSTKNWNAESLQELKDEQRKVMDAEIKKVYAAIEKLRSQSEKMERLMDGLSETMRKNEQEIEKLNKCLHLREDGSAVIGTEGNRLDIIGEVFINGTQIGGAE